MSDFEQGLKEALRREMPPEGFTDRLLARVARERERRSRRERWGGLFGPRGWRWAVSLAAMVMVLLAGFQYERQRRNRREGEQAKQQVLLALKMTAQQLRDVEKSLRQCTVSRGGLERNR